ncbi:MAG: Glu/Leu/Phe/Val dehydrogenase dimerization region [Mycobacterium sp.]|nr:Glu/Leu/Phe/Val dehydrogenase dimerization region [Mycobacterium sp.]
MSDRDSVDTPPGPVFSPAGAPGGHEQVVFCSDPASGLRAIIAIYSTALGPALGGTRFHPYATEQAAIDDALRLSRAMAYKNACAGLDHGGGKAVIIGDPATDKTEPLLRAFGRFIASLGGRYVTACDVGTTVADMDVIARETRFATGRSPEFGGAGDSSVLTAFGVFQGMRAAAQHRWGAATLRGKHVGVLGVGKVGTRLVGHLVADGATVTVADVDAAAVEATRAAHPDGAVLVGDPETLAAAEIDVFAPCALGGILTTETVKRLQATVVCGGANNQLAEPGVGRQLADAGILYAPDYLVNAGGVIQVSDELAGFSFPRAERRAAQIFDAALRVFRLAEDEDVTPEVAADRLAERRMADVGRLRAILLP